MTNKSKNKNSNNSQLVLAGQLKNLLNLASKQKQSNNKKGKKKNKKGSKNPNHQSNSQSIRRLPSNGNSDSKKFFMAVRNPFCREAYGARIPDFNSYTTIPVHQRGTFTIKSDATGGASFVWFGGPFHTLWTGNGSAVDVPFTGYGANPPVYYTSTPSQMYSDYQSYRQVVSGLKIKSLLTPLTSTGKIIVANVPAKAVMPGWNSLNLVVGAGSNILQSLVGITPTGTGGIPTNSLNYFDAQEATLTNLLDNEIIAINKPISEAAFPFKNCTPAGQDGISATQIGGNYAVYNSSTGTETTIDTSMTTNDCEGFNITLVVVTGAPASTNILDIDFIQHLEGIAQLVSSSANQYVADAPKPNKGWYDAGKILDFLCDERVIRMVKAYSGFAPTGNQLTEF